MSEFAMSQLFDVYYFQCPNSKIKYAIYNEKKQQGHIVLEEGIEIIYFDKYQGSESGVIRFAFAREDEEYYFIQYDEAKKHWEMPTEQFNEYVESITL